MRVFGVVYSQCDTLRSPVRKSKNLARVEICFLTRIFGVGFTPSAYNETVLIALNIWPLRFATILAKFHPSSNISVDCKHVRLNIFRNDDCEITSVLKR